MTTLKEKAQRVFNAYNEIFTSNGTATFSGYEDFKSGKIIDAESILREWGKYEIEHQYKSFIDQDKD